MALPVWAGPEQGPLIPAHVVQNPCAGHWNKLLGLFGSPLSLQRYGIKLDKKPLGAGAEGKVWRGEMTVDGKTVYVVVKEPNFLARWNLEHEYAVAKALYGNRVQLLKVGNKPYLVMEMFPHSASESSKPARTLADMLEKDPRFSEDPSKRDPKLIAEIMEAVLTEVDRFHQHPSRLIHGDIKPGNILIGFDGNGKPIARLIDFGTTRGKDLEPPKSRFFKLFGTDGYLSRDYFSNRLINPEYDMAAVRRMLFQTVALGEMNRIHSPTGIGQAVLRGKGAFEWLDPNRILDDGHAFPAEWGLILQSDIARDVKTFREMLEEAKDQATFPEKYAKRWSEVFKMTDLAQRDDNVYHLVAAQNLGPKVFSHLSAADQKSVLDQLKFRQGWLKTERAKEETAFGWHQNAGPLLEGFLKNPLVKEKARAAGIVVPD